MITYDNGVVVYETVDELMAREITHVEADEENYYVWLKETDNFYDEATWVVNKASHEVSLMNTAAFIGHTIDSTTEEIEVSEFEKSF